MGAVVGVEAPIAGVEGLDPQHGMGIEGQDFDLAKLAGDAGGGVEAGKGALQGQAGPLALDDDHVRVEYFQFAGDAGPAVMEQGRERLYAAGPVFAALGAVGNAGRLRVSGRL